MAAMGVLHGASVLALMWPAIWNGFPLAMIDTFRYLREASGDFAWVSSQYYGHLLGFFSGTSLWFVVLLQALVTVWVMRIFLRQVCGLGSITSSVVIMALGITSPLALFASLIMTDVWIGLGLVAALTLLLARPTPVASAVLALVVTFGGAVHPVALPILGVTLLGAAAAFAFRRLRLRSHERTGRQSVAVGAFVAAVLLLTINNGLVWGKWTPNPHSSVVTFAYLLSHGDLDDELSTCSEWEVCGMQARPRSGVRGFVRFLQRRDSYLNDELGGPTAFADDAQALVISHVTSDPFDYFGRIVSSSWTQLGKTDGWRHVDGAMRSLSAIHAETVRNFSTSDEARFLRSRQGQGTLDLSMYSSVREPFAALGALVVTALMCAALWRRVRNGGRHGEGGPLTLALGCLLGLYVVHAFTIGAATFPVNRYGARVLWLVTAALWIAVASTVPSGISKSEY